MKFQNVQATIIRTEHRQGVAKKTQQPYSFYLLVFVDSEYNKFEAPVPNSALVEGIVPDWLLEAKNLEAYLEIEVVPAKTGFGSELKVLEVNQE